jgi:hypothetical protein
VTRPTDESSIGIWLWLAEIILIFSWVPIDLWLYHHHHELLTTEFKEGLRNQLWGPVIVGLCCFSVGAFTWHMLNTRDGG